MDLWYLKATKLKKDTNHQKSYSVYEFTILFGGLPYPYAKFY